MITRREWIRQAAGAAAIAAAPAPLTAMALSQVEPDKTPSITGKNSLKARASARGLLTGCAVSAGLLRRR